jgi:tRNA A-37 threonylcarbamoyl transferase component Bud32
VSDERDPLLGQQLGNYQLVRRLGGGGMGVVYEARHAVIGKRVAVKTLRSDLVADRDTTIRFFNEARATSELRHPGIIEVFDFGYSGSLAYLVMELLEGESLRERVQREGGLPTPVVLAMMRQIAGALGAAHAQGIVHRDLKPDNVFVVPYPDLPAGFQCKVLDFGIAKLRAGESDGPSVKGATLPMQAVAMTAPGSMLGTPLYMSPEHWLDVARVDHRSDVYSLGCMMFEMLTGRPPFLGATLEAVLSAHLSTPPPSLGSLRADVPARIATLVASMLAKDPVLRPERMDDIVARCHDDVATRDVTPQLISHLRVAKLLIDRCRALVRADASAATAIGAFLAHRVGSEVMLDHRDLRRGEISQLFPEMRQHLEQAHQLLQQTGKHVAAYQHYRTAPLTLDMADEACSLLMDACPEIDWDEQLRIEEASVADGGNLGPSRSARLAFWLVLLGVLAALVVFGWIALGHNVHRGHR